MKLNLKLIFLSLISVLIFSNSKASLLEDNLFEKIINARGSITSVSEFSATYSSLGIKEILISDVTSNSFKFSLRSDLLFINSNEKILTNKEFIISKDDNGVYFLKSDNEWQIKNSLQKRTFDIVENNSARDIKSIPENELQDLKYEDLIIFTETLFELISYNLQPNLDNENTFGKRKYEGTGIGFHSNLADANMFCANDHKKILAAHPGWWSPGISYACAFGSDHFCVCTSNFYSGTP